MELVTKQTEIKSRIDRIVRLQSDVGFAGLTFFFNVSSQVGDEEFGEYFDTVTPLTIPISEIEVELAAIFKKALQIRAEQIEGISAIKTLPDYKGFYAALLSLDIFRLAQQLSATQLEINAAYSDVGFVLGNAIAGAENLGALQVAFDRLLLVLGNAVTEEHRQQLQNAIETSAIPLKLQEDTSNETDNKV